MSEERKYLNYRDMKSLKEILDNKRKSIEKQSEIVNQKFDNLLKMLEEANNKKK